MSEGFKVMEKPKPRIYRKNSNVINVINEFIGSPSECIGKEYEDKDELNRVYITTRSYIRNHKITGIKVAKRKNILYIYKEG